MRTSGASWKHFERAVVVLYPSLHLRILQFWSPPTFFTPLCKPGIDVVPVVCVCYSWLMLMKVQIQYYMVKQVSLYDSTWLNKCRFVTCEVLVCWPGNGNQPYRSQLSLQIPGKKSTTSRQKFRLSFWQRRCLKHSPLIRVGVCTCNHKWARSWMCDPVY